MNELNLFKLDIRLLDPIYSLRKGHYTSPERTDFGIFYLDGSDLNVIKIQGGWDIFKAAKAVFGGIYCPAPVLHSSITTDIFQGIMEKEKPTEHRFPKQKFRVISEKFVEEYTLGRLESEITSAEEYIITKQNMPLADCIAIQECGDETFRNQKRLVDKLEQYVRSAPAIFYLPPNPKGIYREVRLDNKFSRCITTYEEYEKFNKGYNSPNTNLTICDFVIEYSPRDFYIVEVKVKKMGRRMGDAGSKLKIQLSKAALFFQKNFQVYPTLVAAVLNYNNKGKEKLNIDHYKFLNKELKKISYPEKKYLRRYWSGAKIKKI